MVMSQTKAALYHQSKEVRVAVSSIISKPVNWQQALDLTVRDGQLLGTQYRGPLGWERGSLITRYTPTPSPTTINDLEDASR